MESTNMLHGFIGVIGAVRLERPAERGLKIERQSLKANGSAEARWRRIAPPFFPRSRSGPSHVGESRWLGFEGHRGRGKKTPRRVGRRCGSGTSVLDEHGQSQGQ